METTKNVPDDRRPGRETRRRIRSLSEAGVTTGKHFMTIFVPTAEGRETHLSNCLVRLAFQERKNFEVIVSSDGPMPELARIVKTCRGAISLRVEEGDTRCGLWGHPQTAEAIARMRGDWFVRVNDDNVIYPIFSRRIEEVASEGLAQIVIWKILVTGGAHQGRILPTRLPPRVNDIDMMNFCVRRDVAQRVGFPSHAFAADWDFLSACLRETAGEYSFIPEVLGEHW